MAYSQVADEPCLFQNRRTIVFFYVDDLVILSKREHMKDLHDHKKQLLATVEGERPRWFKLVLNIEIIHDRSHKTITLVQSSYIDKLV